MEPSLNPGTQTAHSYVRPSFFIFEFLTPLALSPFSVKLRV